MNTAELRAIAEAADGKQWRIDSDPDHPAAGGRYAHHKIEPHVCEVFYTNEIGAAYAAHIVAFQPARVKALLDCVEALGALEADPVGYAARYAARAALKALEAA